MAYAGEMTRPVHHHHHRPSMFPLPYKIGKLERRIQEARRPFSGKCQAGQFTMKASLIKSHLATALV